MSLLCALRWYVLYFSFFYFMMAFIRPFLDRFYGILFMLDVFIFFLALDWSVLSYFMYF